MFHVIPSQLGVYRAYVVLFDTVQSKLLIISPSAPHAVVVQKMERRRNIDKVRNLREVVRPLVRGGYSRAERLTKKLIDCLPSGQKK